MDKKMWSNNKIGKNIDSIKQLEERQLDVGMRMLSAFGGALYPLDLFAIGALKRSMSLCLGFALLIEDYNLTCAGALIRMQLDNALRFHAAFLVSDPHKFASDLLEGIPVPKLKDRAGKKLTDRYLVDQLSKDYPWISKVYEETSKLVHLTEKHIFRTMRPDREEDLSVKIEIFSKNNVDEIFYLEATEAFLAATEVFLTFIEGWIFTKDNPDKVAEIKRLISDGKKGDA